MLRTLEGYLGEQTMARVMRTFHERWRFRHPGSDDFFAVVNEVSGQDLSWYFDQVIRGTDIVDYDIGSAQTRPVPNRTWRVRRRASGRQTVSSSDARREGRQNARGTRRSAAKRSSSCGGAAA